MTKDEYDNIEVGDKVEVTDPADPCFGTRGKVTKGNPSLGWFISGGLILIPRNIGVFSVVQTQAPTPDLSGWYLQSDGTRLELQLSQTSAGYSVVYHGAATGLIYALNITEGTAAANISQGIWVKEGSLFGIDGRSADRPFKVGDVIRVKGPGSKTATVEYTNGLRFTVRYDDRMDRTYDLPWDEAKYFEFDGAFNYPVKIKRETKPKIDHYPHRCDCGAPAFAGILFADCSAKCSKPNVRNV